VGVVGPPLIPGGGDRLLPPSATFPQIEFHKKEPWGDEGGVGPPPLGLGERGGREYLLPPTGAFVVCNKILEAGRHADRSMEN